MTQEIHTIPPAKDSAGRWYFVLVGLSVAALGALFFCLMGRSFLRALEMRSWPDVPCLVTTSELEERTLYDNATPEFRHLLSHTYDWHGKTYTGDRISLRPNPWSSRRAVVEDRAKLYPLGMATTCKVNPENPQIAILKPESLAPGYSIWFPTLFIIGGCGIAIRAVRPPKKQS